jgi:hypothetical protein
MFPAYADLEPSIMTSLATKLWPRWLRVLLVGVITAVVLGGGLFSYRYFAKPVFLTVAAGSADGEALSLINQGRWR